MQWISDPSEVVVPPRYSGSPVVELLQRAATQPTCILCALFGGPRVMGEDCALHSDDSLMLRVVTCLRASRGTASNPVYFPVLHLLKPCPPRAARNSVSRNFSLLRCWGQSWLSPQKWGPQGYFLVCSCREKAGAGCHPGVAPTGAWHQIGPGLETSIPHKCHLCSSGQMTACPFMSPDWVLRLQDLSAPQCLSLHSEHPPSSDHLPMV